MWVANFRLIFRNQEGHGNSFILTDNLYLRRKHQMANADLCPQSFNYFGIADFLSLLLALNLLDPFQGGLFKKTLVGW